MRQRCNPKHASNPRYAAYAGRGIRVCEEWASYISFRAWALANGYDDSLSIDRIDNDGNYDAANCRWVSMKVQSINKRQNVSLTYLGETKTISEWVADPRITVSSHTIYQRAAKGETPESIFADDSRKFRVLEAFGERKSVAEWTRDARCKVSPLTLRNRIHHGWLLEEAMTKPKTK